MKAVLLAKCKITRSREPRDAMKQNETINKWNFGERMNFIISRETWYLPMIRALIISEPRYEPKHRQSVHTWIAAMLNTHKNKIEAVHRSYCLREMKMIFFVRCARHQTEHAITCCTIIIIILCADMSALYSWHLALSSPHSFVGRRYGCWLLMAGTWFVVNEKLM